MDFKSLISKLDSIEAPKETPKAPKLPDAITLNEDATLRVLAGTSTVLKELDMNLIKAAQKGQEGKPIGKPDSESDKNVKKKYGYRMDGEPAERDDDETKQDRRGRKRKNTGESIIEDGGEGVEDLMAAAEEEYKEPGRHIDNLQDVMNSTFGAEQSPEFERARDIINRYLEFVTNTDIDHYDDEEDPDHEDEPMIRAMRHGNIQKHIREYDLGDYLAAALSELNKVVRKGESFNRRAFESKFAKMVEAKKMKGKKADDKMEEASCGSSKKKSMKEAAKPDFLDVDKDGDKKEPMKKAAKEAGKGEKKPADKKGMTAAQKKLPPGLQKAIAKKKGKTESVRRSKRVVAESLEPILKFQDMLKLVQESGGQQQIDPLDKTLFAWATRVARNKLGEGLKAEVYAGMIYERNGGRFEMYDVLAESKKKIDEDWRKKLAAAGMAGVMGLGALGGAQAADMPDRDSASDRAVASQSDSVRLSDLEDQVKDLAKVDRKAAKSYEASKDLHDKWLMKSKSPEDMKRADKDYARQLQLIIKLSTKA